MPNFVTYLSLEMNPNSATPNEIVNKLTKLGWTPVFGDWDFAWNWGTKWQPNGHPTTTNGGNTFYWRNINKTYKVLQGLKVDFSFRTYQKGKETGPSQAP